MSLTHFSFGQKEAEIVKHNLILSVTPHHLFDLYQGSSVNAGFDIRANNRYSFYGEFGKYLPHSLVANNYEQSGHTILGELKRYFESGKTYISVQYMYGEQNYLRADPFDAFYEYDETFYEVYQVSKSFQDFSLRYGGLFTYQNGLSFSPYFGLGVRFQDVSTNRPEKDESSRSFYATLSPHRLFQKDGKTSYLKVHTGIRIGIKIF